VLCSASTALFFVFVLLKFRLPDFDIVVFLGVDSADSRGSS
jgi:hypothetical protein